jgi:hypothetical protein
VLHLGSNGMGDAGATAVADALLQCGALTELHLTSNAVGEGGGLALAAALPYCATLRRLSLAHNTCGCVRESERVSEWESE